MDKPQVTAIFEKAVELGASDVHIVTGSPIVFRVDGELMAQTKQLLTEAQAEQFVRAVIGDMPFARLKEDREVDVGYQLKNGVRLRVNCHFERGYVGLAARLIPSVIPALADLHLEEIAAKVCHLREGLVLFTGPTGEGKSTSLASLIHSINQERAENIITLEDPIEFLFPAGKGLVRQREYMQDFLSFAEAMKRVLRQDPDIVMVGEMRDPETIAAALTLAETGHLIFATLHTPNTVQTLDRIIDVFPPHQQPQIRSQLSMSLQAVVAQRLLPKVGGGRVALREILLMIPAVANIIRENRAHELMTVLQTQEGIGMVTFGKAAKNLLKDGLISKETYEQVVAGW